MKIFGRDLAHELAIVAEIGVNHEGDIEAASRLLRLAAESGANAVKFQSYTPARYASANDPARLERVTRFALDEAAHRRLAREARELGVAFFSTPLTEDWVPLLAELGGAIKIASGDLTFEPVIRAAARTDRPVIISTGLSTVDEIDAAVDWVRQEVGPAALAERLILMHCVAAYPTPLEQASLRTIPFLAERYGLTVGYSNHVIGPEACHGAVALGAPILEVHFTDKKTGRTFRDHELSFEPAELARLRTIADGLRSGLGKPGRERPPCEAGNVDALRKGVVAARDLSAGTVLGKTDLMYARPATQFPASALPDLVGQRLKQSLRRGELIQRAAIEG